ncbi:uncharacterized protein LOC126889418 [Diabrotica virgifera virgifera]|uniref:Uncharacterized protein n=1 Tax=Diabrotica virgifera virgifera TaxID=50390 RepID=A0ABM5KU08_DIAVI|nr:uncharacterized protein LOC126889418 [Diabrotica virgifera virgifera]
MNQNNRKSNFYPIICCLLITWLFIYTSNAQLTFSKGWKIGKRTEDEPDSQIKISANAICHFLVSQIRQMSACNNNHPNNDLENIINEQL